jgi:beta-mannanase
MWRHVHDVFARAGATNVTWVWCPNVEYSSSIKPLATLYPGDGYVDWTCLDGYNWGAGVSGWLPFATLFGPTYDLVTRTIAPSKPLMIAETASSESGGSKAAWISDMLGTQLPTRFRNVAAVMWFDKYDDSMDWPIETSPAAQAAFAAAIRSPYYAPAAFGALATSPIPPPR